MATASDPLHDVGMQNIRRNSTTAMKPKSLVPASVCLFSLGSLNAILYVIELITSGGRYIQMLEASCALLVGSWVIGAVHLRRGRAAKTTGGAG
jgi:hypothetical protein